MTTPANIRMTAQEKKVMEHLVKFWNSFVQLDNPPRDADTVCDAVHLIQGILATRVARRANPEIWRHDVNCEVQPPSPVRPLIELPLTIVPSNWWVAKDEDGSVSIFRDKPFLRRNDWIQLERIKRDEKWRLAPPIVAQLPAKWRELRWDKSAMQQTEGGAE